LSDTHVYEPYIRALLGTASQFCEVVVLNSSNGGTPAHGAPRPFHQKSTLPAIINWKTFLSHRWSRNLRSRNTCSPTCGLQSYLTQCIAHTLNPNSKHQTPNPKPQTTNLRTETQNPKPQTRNPKPQTRNLKPQARNPKPQTPNPNPKPQTRRNPKAQTSNLRSKSKSETSDPNP
jgi:hypothetical protein